MALTGLALALAAGIWKGAATDWDLAALAVLLALAVAADLTSTHLIAGHVRVSGSFIAIMVAIVVLGPAPAAAIALTTIVAGMPTSPASRYEQIVNLATYAAFPLVAGIAFAESAGALGLTGGEPLFYLLAVGAFALALAINFSMIAGSACYLERSDFGTKARRALLPILPSELISALLAVTVAYMYWELGLVVLSLVGIALVSFQYMLGALLVSQRRSDELELRAEQLAGFQVGLLSAMLRTLDLRDKMTARHSAAVARYTREVAVAAGLDEREVELAHTAGLLHDIGKFIFPDRLLSGEGKLSEEDWEIIRSHPEEGARIVSQIDGYAPVSDVILAHHERIDGCGYPHGIEGDEIPIVSRIIAVADTYDVMTARDSYRKPGSSAEAIAELRRVSGTQLDGRLVELFVEILESKGVAYRHGEDADFDAELSMDRRVHDYVNADVPDAPRLLVR